MVIVFYWTRSLQSLLTFCFTGTIIDNKICHPRNYDFYLCAHAGMIVSIHFKKMYFVDMDPNHPNICLVLNMIVAYVNIVYCVFIYLSEFGCALL